jgi:hypothetical protein
MPRPNITDPRRREINELLDRLGSPGHPDYSRLKYEIEAKYPHYNPREEKSANNGVSSGGSARLEKSRSLNVNLAFPRILAKRHKNTYA